MSDSQVLNIATYIIAISCSRTYVGYIIMLYLWHRRVRRVVLKFPDLKLHGLLRGGPIIAIAIYDSKNCLSHLYDSS